MAYSTLINYNSGDVPPASQLNQASDNLRSLRQFNSYGVQLSLSDDVSIPNTTYQVITWDHVDYQIGDMWVVGTPTRIICRVAGRHAFLLNAEWHSQSGGERTIWLETNISAVVTRFDLSSQGSNAGGGAQSGLEIVELAVGDYVRLGVYHAFGSALDIRGNGKDRTNVFSWLMGVG